jgi:hypothetical protein
MRSGRGRQFPVSMHLEYRAQRFAISMYFDGIQLPSGDGILG